MTSSSHGKPLETISSSIRSVIKTKPETSRGSSTSSRRTRIPEKPKNVSLNLWSFLRNCIGRDLTQIALPVNFSEPLSILQRMTEDLEYAHLLDKAAGCSCPYEQLAYFAVFVISGYASSWRTTKPFNPLLGETFEFDRTEDLGWRSVSEQVSHHPPISAHHCEGRNWIFYQDFLMESRFTGRDLQVTPTGEGTVEFHQGRVYRWNKVRTVVHNFFFGSLWVAQQGEIDIIGEKGSEGIRCNLKFIPDYGGSMRRVREYRRVKGEIFDHKGIIRWKLDGNWDDQVEITPVVSYDGSKNPVFGKPVLAWRCNDLIQGSENYYSFSEFTCQLNEPEDNVAPTDSRLRPDQRLMEEGRWDEANLKKIELEEKQRTVMREQTLREQEAKSKGKPIAPYTPLWFEAQQKEDGRTVYIFRGEYWQCKEKQDWSRCPNLFS